MPNKHAKVIVNPAAGSQATRRCWPEIQSLLRNGGLSFDYQYTEGTGHATQLARNAASDGYHFVVAVGGDGTINEVANGVLTAEQGAATTMGIVSTGTGNDFVHSLGLASDFASACRRLSGEQRANIDVGLVEFTAGGKRCERYYVNGAGVGFDGEIAENMLTMPKNLGHTLPFVMGLLKTLPAYRNKQVKLTINGRVSEERVLSIVVSNGPYFGGGMKIAPAALPSDRQLDVIAIGDIGKLELLKVFPRVYKGTHITHPKVKTCRAEKVTIESADRILLQADGELLGEGPVNFSIIPHALCLAV